MSPENRETVLIVEDDAGVAQLEQMYLERAGFQTLTAVTAEEALESVRRHALGLILLDYRLPGDMDGLDFYAQLKAEGYDLPVILVTGFSDEATVIRALRAGVRDLVTKSAEYLDYLPEAVQRVLRQVRTERRLAESEARLASIIDSAKDAILTAGTDQRITIFNKAAEQIFRCPAAEAVGQPLSRFIPREYRRAPGAQAGAFQRPTESLSSLVEYGNRGVRADGTEFPLETSLSRTEVGGRKFYTIIVRDITERKQAVEELLKRDRLLAETEKQARLGSWEWDPHADRMTWTDGLYLIFGVQPKEFNGNLAAFLERVHPEDRARVREVVETALHERASFASVFRVLCPDGSVRMVHSQGECVPGENGNTCRMRGVCQDVSEKKQLEAQLQQAQRMEGIGLLAGGVAHDFNNLLTVINGYSEILLGSMAPGDPSYDLLREIRKAGERAESLTRQLLAFSRKQMLQPVILDLNALVAETKKMLGRLIGEDIDLATSLDPALHAVKADPGQIEQVLINLAVNARDAMPTGGQLTIETRNVVLDEFYARHHQEVRPGAYVLLSMTDTGNGMDEATKARIFEPFFTTKEVGKGTGLGLATVYGIVRQSGGYIAVYSEVGWGTTFKVYLPHVAAAASSGKALVGLSVPQGTETVLLAEDEAATRSLLRLSLQSYGYTVLDAQDGEEALQCCRRHPGPIHLLVTDVVMPKMNGRQLARQVVALRPDAKVLYLSGYTDDAIVRHGVLEEETAFLQKPFTPSVLVRKVREVLEAGQGSGDRGQGSGTSD